MATQLATLFVRRLEVPVVMRDLEHGARRRAASPASREEIAKGRYDEGKARFLGSLVSGVDRLGRLRATATSCSRPCSSRWT